MLQAAWCWVVCVPLLLLNTSPSNPALAWTDGLGVALWAVGFVVETTADFQKFAFKQDPANRGRFVDVGLWRWARYPNYGGEMLVWWGTLLGCCAPFRGADWAAVASPLFVMFLLLCVRWAGAGELCELRGGSSPEAVHSVPCRAHSDCVPPPLPAPPPFPAAASRCRRSRRRRGGARTPPTASTGRAPSCCCRCPSPGAGACCPEGWPSSGAPGLPLSAAPLVLGCNLTAFTAPLSGAVKREAREN